MRIAQIAPLAESVPPKKYGGTERVIYALTEELVKMGHDVTLFASGDSQTSAKLVSVYPVALRYAGLEDLYGYNSWSILNNGLVYSMQDQFDIIHDHNPLMGLPTANIAKVPVVTTWHGPFDDQVTPLFEAFNNPFIVGISNSQAKPVRKLNLAGVVYNGLIMDDYPFSDTHDNYLLFVGRISHEKGIHHAIDAAVKLKQKLIIAAKLDKDVPVNQKYYRDEIEPRLKKHAKYVTWIGEVDEQERNKLMSRAKAFLHPVTWPEPFGLTLIESMACGTPVVAFGLGSIPEIIQDGKTGFVVKNVDEMVEAVKKIDQIDRAACRRYSISNYGARRMAEGYLEIYKKLVKEHQAKKKVGQQNFNPALIQALPLPNRIHEPGQLKELIERPDRFNDAIVYSQINPVKKRLR